jgi:hypothetical protein
VGAAAQLLERGERTVVAAKVQTGSRELNGGLQVAFYDGDPVAGGTLFGVDRKPHLHADSTYDFRVGFGSNVCGTHNIYIVVGSGTRHEHTAKLRPIEVAGEACEGGVPPSQATLRGKAGPVDSGRANGEVSLSGKLLLSEALDLSQAALRVDSVLNESGGAGELLRGPAGTPILPQTFTARLGSTTTRGLFESTAGAQPRLRLEVKTREPDNRSVELKLKVKKGLLAAPLLCAANGARTGLTTQLTLDDGVHAAQVLEWTQPWQCEEDSLTTP